MDRKITFSLKREAVVPEPPPVIQPPNQLWRVRHDYEIYVKGITWAGHGQINAAAEDALFREGYPEVFWCYADDTRPLPLTEQWQWLSYLLSAPIYPMMWREVYDDWRAFANGTGFPHPNIPGTPGYDKTYIPVPKRDYINKIDLTAPDLPALDKVRVCGGATVSGYQDGNYVILDTLDADNPPQTVDYIRNRPWLYFSAVSKLYRRDASGKLIRDANGLLIPIIDKFPQNGSYPTWIPLVARGRVRLPVVLLEKVDKIFDPYKVVV